jgi:hypothetical protein
MTNGGKRQRKEEVGQWATSARILAMGGGQRWLGGGAGRGELEAAWLLWTCDVVAQPPGSRI